MYVDTIHKNTVTRKIVQRGVTGLFENGTYTHPKCVVCVRLGLVTLPSQVERRSLRSVGDTVFGVRCPIKFRGRWTNFRGEYAMTKMVPRSKSLGKSLCQHACWRFPARLAPRHHSPMSSNWGMCHLKRVLILLYTFRLVVRSHPVFEIHDETKSRTNTHPSSAHPPLQPPSLQPITAAFLSSHLEPSYRCRCYLILKWINISR